MLRRKCRYPVITERPSGSRKRISDRKQARVEHTDDITRIGFVYHFPILRHQLLRLAQAEFLASLNVIYFLPCIKAPGADTHKRDAVPVGFIHIRLNLKDKRGERLFFRFDIAFVGMSGRRLRRHLKEMFEECRHTEVRQGGTEKHRAELALRDHRKIHLLARAVQQFTVLQKLFIKSGSDQALGSAGIIDRNAVLRDFLLTVHSRFKRHDALARAVVNAFKLPSAADRPVHRAGRNAEDAFDVIHQLERIERFAVHLINKRKDRNMPHHADLKEFDRLRLHALRSIDDHDRRVRRHQGAVGVLRKILVSGRIKQVHTAAVILELQDRGSDRDTALLFDLHPVRDRMTSGLFSFHGAREIDRAAVEQKLFGQCRLTRVRVRNDRKCASSGYFLCNGCLIAHTVLRKFCRAAVSVRFL